MLQSRRIARVCGVARADRMMGTCGRRYAGCRSGAGGSAVPASSSLIPEAIVPPIGNRVIAFMSSPASSSAAIRSLYF